jgi:hypothetical protein
LQQRRLLPATTFKTFLIFNATGQDPAETEAQWVVRSVVKVADKRVVRQAAVMDNDRQDLLKDPRGISSR